MKELTKAEEQIMQAIWQIDKGFINDIIDKLPEPKPAYTTVTTIVRILEQKKFVAHQTFGRVHQYYALVDKENYSKDMLQSLTRNYFSNSYKNLASFFTKDEKISLKELEEIQNLIAKQIEDYKQQTK